MAKRLSKEFLQRLRAVRGKRSRIVVDHILKHGFITTEDLDKNYGYGHAPRARQDVIDQGIPIETYYVKSSRGKRIAAYRFGDASKLRGETHTGRKALPKKFKQRIIELNGCRCVVCMAHYEPRYLQIDHRVPGCYWASPANYSHIAGIDQRRLELVWIGAEVSEHERLSAAASDAMEPLPEFVKKVLRKASPPLRGK